MKKALLAILLTILIGVSLANSTANLNAFFDQTDIFLKKYVKNGLVDYKKAKQNLSEIQNLYDFVNTADLSNSSEVEKKAFYLNAYNVITIYYVTAHYPLTSKVNESGFFREKHLVANKPISLDYLEHRIIRSYKDPRVHFYMVSAANGSPRISNEALRPTTLDKQLSKITTQKLNDPSFIQIDDKSHEVKMSSIFKWYATDFVAKGEPITKFVNQFVRNPIPASWSIDYYDFDWALNEL